MLVAVLAEHDTPTQAVDIGGHDLGSESSSPSGPQGAGLETQRLRAAIGSRLFGEPTEATPTTKIGRHTLLEPLGSGGMGVVYTAYDPQLDRRVAIKVLHAGASEAKRERASRRLLAEAQAMAKLNHPNVIAVHDAGVEDGRVFVAMEFVDAGTLGSWCEQHPPSDRPRFEAVLELLLQAGRGLVAAHAAGLVHRDLKPANMLVDRQGRLRVADFGLARIHADDSDAGSEDATRSAKPDDATPRTDVAGTPAYMAPEQFEGRSDARSDQWSWCATAWEAAYGQRPFPGTNMSALMLARQAGAPASPKGRPEVPGWFHRVLERGLAPDPAARYPSMSALLRDLDHRRRRGRRVAAVVGVGALVGVAAMGWSGRADPPAEPSRCDGLTAVVEAVYDPGVRAQIVDATRARHGKVAAAAMERPLSRLDDYSAAWLAGAQQACRAIERDGGLSDAAIVDQADGAMRCYRSALDEMAVVVAEELEAPQLVGAFGAVEALPPLDRCRHAAADVPEESGNARVIARWLAQANVQLTMHDHPGARASLDHASALLDDATTPTQRAKVDYLRGVLADREGDHAAALAHGADALTQAERGGDPDAVAEVWVLLADASTHAHQEEQAGFYLDRARSIAERAGRPAWLVGSTLRLSAALAHHRGDNERALAELDEAIALYEPLYGADSTTTTRLRDTKVDVLRALGRREEAIAVGRRSIEAFARRYGPGHPQTAKAQGRVGAVLEDLGDLEGAIELFREAFATLEDTPGVDPVDRVAEGFLLAQALGNARRFDEARDIATRTRALAVEAVGEGQPLVNLVDVAHATLELDAGNYGRAIEMYERLARVERGVRPNADAVNDHVLCMNLAVAYARADRPQDATTQLQRCDEMALVIEPPHPLHFPSSDRYAGEVLQRVGELEQARERYVRSADVLDEQAPERLDRAFAHLGIVEIDLARGVGEGLDAQLDVVERVLGDQLQPELRERLRDARDAVRARQTL